MAFDADAAPAEDETLRRRAGMGQAIDDLARLGLLIDAEVDQ